MQKSIKKKITYKRQKHKNGKLYLLPLGIRIAMFGFAAIRRKLSQKLEYKNKILIVQTIVEIDFTKLITKTEMK